MQYGTGIRTTVCVALPSCVDKIAVQVPDAKMLLLCRILIEDPDVQSTVLWQNMQLVEPWENDDVSDEIFKINPTFMPREQLSPAQRSVSFSAMFILCCRSAG